jgi:DNA (cytosine-5)-methyltransferase 1
MDKSLIKKKITAIDFFCSGGGMTSGMLQAGIHVIAGIDNDPEVKETYEENNIGTKFIEADVFKLKEEDLSFQTGIKKDDDSLIFIGCSPCQFWSIIKTNKSKSKKTKDLLKEFHRFVKYFNPGFVVVENVPGIEKSANESGLNEFVNDLIKRGYYVKYNTYNLNEYGVPQTRKRFSLVATRVDKKYIEPSKLRDTPTVRDFLGIDNGFYEVMAGHKDNSSFRHTVAGLSEDNLETLKRTPKNGGNSVKIRKYFKGDGFRDSYSRMSWDKPAPTITTKFFSISNGRFAHPVENRAISLREGATLQTFRKDYIFYTKSIESTARMIGNAVPPIFAENIGKAILEA